LSDPRQQPVETNAGRAEAGGAAQPRPEALGRAGFEHAPDATLLLDDERRCIDANRAACSLLGVPPEELLSRRLDDFVSEHARPSLDPAWRELLETRSHSGELELVTSGEARLTVEFRTTAGVLPGCHLSVLRDVTGHATVAEVGEGQGSFDCVFEHIDEGLYVLDERRCFSFVNPAAARFLGYDSHEELLGLPVHETIHYKHPDGSRFPAEECPHLGVLDTGQPIRGQDHFVRRDGTTVPVAYSNAPVPLARGRGAVVAFHDITDSNRAQIEQERERELLSTVLESLDTGVVACTAEGALTLFNRATREMHGIPEEGRFPAEWAGHYDLFLRDGRTPMRMEEIPLLRALNGEPVRDAELVIAPKGQPQRTVLCSGRAMQSSDGRTLGAVVAMHDVTERRKVEEQLAHQALHDPLTGLANRQLLLDRLEQSLLRRSRRGGVAGVLFLDLDDFKTINDAHGHDVGDAVLVAVGNRVRDALRDVGMTAPTTTNDTWTPTPHTIGRLGGDEFVVVLEDLTDPADGALAAERILAALQPPLVFADIEIWLAASIGTPVADSGAGAGDGSGSGAQRTPGEVLRDGDTAMHAAKRAGKGRYQIFEAEMQKAILAHTELLRDLRAAVDQGQLRLRYQPQIDVASGRMIGVEALVRWSHPRRGLLTPDRFIPAAETSGLIGAVDDWVMREACAQLRQWDLAGLPELRMAVNVSTGRLITGHLAGDMATVLADAQIAPQRLEIELTETVAVDYGNDMVAMLSSIRELGVSVAIDDFGMGHSSLNRLQSFPIDKLKIDRSFISSLTSDAASGSIAAAMIAIGKGLGLEVTAEGVETQEHLRALRTLGCRSAQGFLFSKPVIAGEIVGLAHAGLPVPPAVA